MDKYPRITEVPSNHESGIIKSELPTFLLCISINHNTRYMIKKMLQMAVIFE